MNKNSIPHTGVFIHVLTQLEAMLEVPIPQSEHKLLYIHFLGELYLK